MFQFSYDSSCVLQAAAALAALTFNPPTPESLTEEPEDDILPIRRKFVGDVDLPECMYTYHALR